jgi:hypothetical protein
LEHAACCSVRTRVARCFHGHQLKNTPSFSMQNATHATLFAVFVGLMAIGFLPPLLAGAGFEILVHCITIFLHSCH